MDVNQIDVKIFSKGWRTAISIILLLVIVFSSMLAISWLNKIGSSEDIAITLFTIIQTLIILLAAWFYIIYLSPKSLTATSLRKLIDEFLVKDVCESLLYVDYSDKNGENINQATNVGVEIVHINGTPRCNYKITKKNTKATMSMYVVMNIRKFEVVYYINSAIKKEKFKITIDGAVHSEYNEKVDFKTECGDEGFEKLTKMVFRRALNEGFLSNPEERLFIANDISVMTRSILNEINK